MLCFFGFLLPGLVVAMLDGPLARRNHLSVRERRQLLYIAYILSVTTHGGIKRLACPALASGAAIIVPQNMSLHNDMIV